MISRPNVLRAWWSLAILTCAAPPVFALQSGATAATTAQTEASTGGSSPTIPGTAGVVDQFTGSFSYDLPISVVPGRHGIQPTVLLHYRSTNGNGQLGVGWEMELGAIERRTKGGVVFSGANQKFVLRTNGWAGDLVPVGGNEYRVQLESGAFLRVRQLIAADNTPCWEVTDRHGTRSRYGESAQSRFTAGPYVFRWGIDSVQDTDGNTMTYAYSIDNTGGLYPQEIDYTGHTSGLTPTNSVVFTWQSRPDIVVDYRPGFWEKPSQLLARIDVKAAGSLVRRYQLGYSVSGATGRSLLTSFSQYGKDGQSLLPVTSFDWSQPAGGFTNTYFAINKYSAWASAGYGVRTADINGDGYDDVIIGPDSNGAWYVMTGSATGLVDQGRWLLNAFYYWSADATNQQLIRFGDVNGDGKQDIIIGPDNTLNMNNLPGNWSVLETNASGNGFVRYDVAQNLYSGWASHPQRIRAFDVNGDGLTDVLIGPDSNGNWYLLRSNGSGFVDAGAYITGAYGNWADDSLQDHIMIADVTGDGLPDIVIGPDASANWYVLENTGTGFKDDGAWLTGMGTTFANGQHELPMDVNGDGRADIVLGPSSTGAWQVLISDGSGFVLQNFGNGYGGFDPTRIRGIDVNGDGMTDLVLGPDSSGAVYVMESNGSSFVDKGIWAPASTAANWDTLFANGNVRSLDANGDGHIDLLFGPDGSGNWWLGQAGSMASDLLTWVLNGYGGETSVQYQPSTRFQQTKLPFALQVVTGLTTTDGNGLSATTQYSYSGGYFHTAEKDFRGFAATTVTGPAWPNGARSQTTTYFHQGNDLAVGTNDPSGAIGYMKGKPYRVIAGDSSSASYGLSETTYAAPPAGAAYYFTPPSDVYTSFCSSSSTCFRQTHSAFGYDLYGNVTREDQYGDTSDTSDDRTVIRHFYPNTTAWIIGLPCDETTYTGTGASPPPTSAQIAGVNYGYDYQSTCSASALPSTGHLTFTSRWLNGGTNPTTSAQYDQFGNPTLLVDANYHQTQTTYDSSTHTFPTSVTNALGHIFTTRYYGVDGVSWSTASSDPGVFGAVQATIDPNNATSTFGYDVFGRRISQADTDGFTTTWSYNAEGTVGSQNVRTSSVLGTSEAYFDGMGRTIKTRHQGSASGAWVISQSQFLVTGAVEQSSSPYFESGGTPVWTAFDYDVRGRVVKTTAPDGTVATACYDDTTGASASVDANGHKMRRVHDVHARPVEIDEYTDTFASCTTAIGTPYATTKYQYKPLETDIYNAVSAVNSPSIVTSYDTLGRKILTSDPDLGNWSYAYDAAGNVKLQTDSNAQALLFNYDSLNRVTLKHPCSTPSPTVATCQAEPASPKDVTTAYDDPSVAYSKGHLTNMTDPSGSSSYTYDALGRQLTRTQTVAGATFTTSNTFDSSRRLQTITYPLPDGTQVRYSYDVDGNLSSVRDAASTYATLSAYNEVGQVGSVTMGDTSTLSYVYDSKTHRISRIAAAKSGIALLDLTYSYDPVGNISTISDAVNANGTQHFRYDALNRLIWAQSPGYAPNNALPPNGLSYNYDPVRVHVLTSTSDGRSFRYDNNGNTLNDSRRTINWDAENRVSSLTFGGATASFVYDGTGARVVKSSGAGSTMAYIGKLFECVNPTPGIGASSPSCAQWTRYVFAGQMQVAQVNSTTMVPSYYQRDHLGSTRIVTSSSAATAHGSYQPFGSGGMDTSAVRYAFTGQEWDAETGLYNYGARLYDPSLGRFVSADSKAGSQPQALNRYSYALNNPLSYADPSGHFPVFAIGAAIGGLAGLVDGILQGDSLTGLGKDMLIGAAAGAVAAETGYLVGPKLPIGVVKIVGTSIIAGSASGATAGGVGAAVNGGNVLRGMEMGAAYGALSGAITGSLLGAGHIGVSGWSEGVSAENAVKGLHRLQLIPAALAAPAGASIAGFIQCGARCAGKEAFVAAFATTVEGAAHDRGWFGYDGRTPTDASARSALASGGVIAVAASTSMDGLDPFFRAVAWLSGSGSHTLHFGDSGAGGYGEDRGYWEIARDVPFAPQGQTRDMGFLDFALQTNCTTRFGYLNPGAIFNAYRYTGVGLYWIGP